MATSYKDYMAKWVNEDNKDAIIYYNHDNQESIMKVGDIIYFQLYGTNHIPQAKIRKGLVDGFAWGGASPPHYIIVKRWREDEQRWGQANYNIHITNSPTGRTTHGIITAPENL